MTDADWSIEMFEDDDGKCPVESWMDKLDEVTYAALSAAIEYVLAPSGISLASSQWLTPLNGGLYEFRVRHTAEEIQAMYARAGREAPKNPAKILLRLFVAFHGQKVILLLDGCDKLEDSSESRQQKEIAKARKLLKAWHLQQAKEKKAKKKGRSGGRERCLDRPESRCVARVRQLIGQ